MQESPGSMQESPGSMPGSMQKCLGAFRSMHECPGSMQEGSMYVTGACRSVPRRPQVDRIAVLKLFYRGQGRHQNAPRSPWIDINSCFTAVLQCLWRCHVLHKRPESILTAVLQRFLARMSVRPALAGEKQLVRIILDTYNNIGRRTTR